MIYVEISNNQVHIAEDNTSGCTYPYKSKTDIIDAFADYIENYGGEII